MPIIISFILLFFLTYVLVATGENSDTIYLPWSGILRNVVTKHTVVAHMIVLALSLLGFFGTGAAVLFVRGKTLMIGGKKTLIVFTALFIIIIILLVMRIMPMFSAFFERQ